MPKDAIHLDWADTDIFWVSLNEQLEWEISDVLREHPDFAPRINHWARTMTEIVPDFANREEILHFIDLSLKEKYEDPLHDSEEIGNEVTLIRTYFNIDVQTIAQVRKTRIKEIANSFIVKDFTPEEKAAIFKMAEDAAVTVCPNNDVYQWGRTNIGLPLIRRRIQLIRPLLDGVRELNTVRARLIRKIYYTYKLWEALIGQVGYYNGSLELDAGLEEDFEFWMYLMQMKLRHPLRQYAFKAPKSMMAYKTGKHSLLPWNNQLSFSLGHHEFGENEMPRFAWSSLEKLMVRALFDRQKKEKLFDLLRGKWADAKAFAEANIIMMQVGTRDSSRPRGNWMAQLDDASLADLGYSEFNLQNVIGSLTNEVDRKFFFTRILGITWSEELQDLEYNVFRHILESGDDARVDKIRAALDNGAIKDIRLTEQPGFAGGDPVQFLADATERPHVIGRSANILVKPEEVEDEFRAKIVHMKPEQRAYLYDNVIEQGLLESDCDVDTIVAQAMSAANAWIEAAEANRKPVYTGPSGHVVTYTNMYCQYYQIAEQSDMLPNGAPTIHEVRLVLLAALIGKNQHHSYDEAMTASHGLSLDGVELTYDDRQGYQDILRVEGHGDIAAEILRRARSIANAAILMIRKSDLTIQEGLVDDWFYAATGTQLR